MSSSQEMATERLLHNTTSLCKVCKNALPAKIIATPNGEVILQKICPSHGRQEIKISNNAQWYEETRRIKPRFTPPRNNKKEVTLGCPFDCGPCTSHEQKVRLPVVTITSSCNLDCPICYVHNKNDDPYHMTLNDFAKILDHLKAEHGEELDIVNLTGGEPMLHPNFEELLALAHQKGVHRVTICSNGISLVKDEALVERLAKMGARIALSFDTFQEEADFLMQGARLLETKLKTLELCKKHNLDVTLIPVMTKGVNDHEIGDLIRLGMEHPSVRHVEVHTITYTGQGGINFPRAGRISMYEVLQRIEETTNGLLRPQDFVPSPCAHPLCYQIAYLVIDPDGGEPIPFTRFLAKEDLYEALSERLYLEPSPKLEETLRESIDRLWAEDGDERTLLLLKNLFAEMFPVGRTLTRSEALRASERWIKAIYIHSHMDEETFDVERVALCCDSNCYPDGSTVPVCNYNVLYREKESNFMRAPKAWNERAGGIKAFKKLPIVV